jgi:hypothetical protein
MARPPDSHNAMLDPHEPPVVADVSPALVAHWLPADCCPGRARLPFFLRNGPPVAFDGQG